MAEKNSSEQSGSPDYETLLQRCADKAYNFALRLSGNSVEAQDMVQEAFARAFEHRNKYDPSRPLDAWINKILFNLYIDAQRRYEKRHSVSLDSPPPTENDSSWSDILPGPDREPIDFMMKSENEKIVHEALQTLPLHYRTAVTLFDIEGRSYEEIGKIMGCGIGTVSSRLHQGRLLLKKVISKLEKHGEVARRD